MWFALCITQNSVPFPLRQAQCRTGWPHWYDCLSDVFVALGIGERNMQLSHMGLWTLTCAGHFEQQNVKGEGISDRLVTPFSRRFCSTWRLWNDHSIWDSWLGGFLLLYSSLKTSVFQCRNFFQFFGDHIRFWCESAVEIHDTSQRGRATLVWILFMSKQQANSQWQNASEFAPVWPHHFRERYSEKNT